MSQFNFKKRNITSGPHLLGVLLILVGLLAVIGPLFFTIGIPIIKAQLIGGGSIILGLMIVSSFEGVLIDFNNKKIKEYFSICGLKRGQWESLPTISVVKMIAKTSKATNTPNGIGPTLSGSISEFMVFIYTQNSEKPIYSFNFPREKEAKANAKSLATNLGAELIAS